MDYTKLKYWLALKSVAGVGNVIFPALVEKFDNLETIFSVPVSEFLSTPGMTKKAAAAITGFNNWDKIKSDLGFIEKSGINIVTYQDELYPAKLLEIYDRPPFLYVSGQLRKDDVCIAMVGSRLASTYGKYTTERISRELSLKGVTVVSGLARGIDSAAHRGALAARGRTIAVTGSGLDIIYPPENKDLFNAIAQNGAVISEFPPGTPPLAAHFPARNRIISGMSYGVVVVEAGEKSGSLITARLALEQGREVFAVPGSIDSAGSRGTNKLIKQGAKLIENIDDIIEEILPQLENREALEILDDSGKTEDQVRKKKDLNTVSRKIVDIISDGRLHVDEIINVPGLSPNDVLSSLMALELNGIIQQFPGKYFSLSQPPI